MESSFRVTLDKLLRYEDEREETFRQVINVCTENEGVGGPGWGTQYGSGLLYGLFEENLGTLALHCFVIFLKRIQRPMAHPCPYRKMKGP